MITEHLDVTTPSARLVWQADLGGSAPPGLYASFPLSWHQLGDLYSVRAVLTTVTIRGSFVVAVLVEGNGGAVAVLFEPKDAQARQAISSWTAAGLLEIDIRLARNAVQGRFPLHVDACVDAVDGERWASGEALKHALGDTELQNSTERALRKLANTYAIQWCVLSESVAGLRQGGHDMAKEGCTASPETQWT